MKALYKSVFVLASVLFLAASCIKMPETMEEKHEHPAEVKPAEPKTKTLNFVLPKTSVSGKTKWEAGDKILVHGEYAAQQVTVTLAAEDISADGKTATQKVENLYPYERDDVASTLYAAYPAEAVDNLKHCFFYTKFNDTNRPLMAASNGKNNNDFNFVDLCAAVTFQVGGDVDGYIFSGNKKETIGYGQYQVKITPETQNYLQYTSDPILSVEGKLSGGKGEVYIPAGVELAGGYTIKFTKGENVTKILKEDGKVSFTQGKASDLGNVTAKAEDYIDPFSADIKDLDKNGNANCYIVTAPGKYKFLAVKGNSATSFLADVAEAKVLWETWNDDSAVEANSVVKSAAYAEDYIIIEMPATLHPGNAVIAAYDTDEKIVWSWHIWVPETAIVTKNYGILAPDMMDRNLGALVAAEKDVPSPVHSFGLMYQWGRKDPFPCPKAVKSSDNATVAGKQIEAMEGTGAVDECKITLEQSIANPTLLGFSQNGSWITPEGNDLWMDSQKTIYDPCPPGYRVPARDKNMPFHASDLTTQTGWSESVDNAQFTLGDPVAVFPLAGYRDDYGPITPTHAYDRAVYWTAYASADAKTGYYVNVRSPGSKHALSEAGKSRAGSVRCVVE